MKSLILSITLGALGLFHSVQSSDTTFELPALHRIKEVTLSPSYSCRTPEEFARGYEKTALFLSDSAKRWLGPDLLFNGACGGADYFEAATAGDDMSLIADLGTGIPLEELSAARAFNVQRQHTFPEYSKFAKAVPVAAGHTYAVLLNGSNRRGLLVFTVTDYLPNKKVSLRYAVKSYQIVNAGQVSSAAGFDWEKRNDSEAPQPAINPVAAKNFAGVVRQSVTLYPPHDQATGKYDETRACFSFKTGKTKVRNSTDWDLGYGFLRMSNEDWLMVGTVPRDKRNVMKELGRFDWSDSLRLPVLEPLPELTAGENRNISVDSSADTHRAWATSTSHFAKAQAGYMYLMHVKDAQADFYILFRVEEIKQGRYCTITWAQIPEPEKG
ncbi:MAG TPA: hypothetical protein VGD61_04255 [Pyrinomonadaceae bacterium]